jgi:hypothetical protein
MANLVTIDFRENADYVKEAIKKWMELWEMRNLYDSAINSWGKPPPEDSFLKKQQNMLLFFKEHLNPENYEFIHAFNNYYNVFTISPHSFQTISVPHPEIMTTPSYYFYGNINFCIPGDKTFNFFHEDNFYTQRDWLSGKKIMLSNGANKRLHQGGGGTTGGLNSLGGEEPNLFFSTWSEVYIPSDDTLIFHGLSFKDLGLRMTPTYSNDSNKSFPPGTVLKTVLPADKFVTKGSTQIVGAYHINGINWASVSERETYEPSVDNILFTYKYFRALLQDFIDSTDADVLYLAQIPGYLYQGGKGTLQGLCKAVSEYSNLMQRKEKYVIIGMYGPRETQPTLKDDLYWFYDMLLYESV